MQIATISEVTDAYIKMTKEERLMLHFQARQQMLGTEYDDPDEVITVTLDRFLTQGRTWNKEIAFPISFSCAIRSVCTASRHLHLVTKRQQLRAFEWDDLEDPASGPEELYEQKQRSERAKHLAEEAKRVLKAEKDVTGIRVLDGLLSGCTAREIAELLRLEISVIYTTQQRVMRRLKTIQQLIHREDGGF